MVKIAIDAMGGDHGASPIVAGVIESLKEKSYKPILVGDEKEILSLLPKGFKDKISIVNSTDIISMSDLATDALKRKESSIYKAIELCKNGEVSGLVSAGHSGASMSLATVRVGRIKGVIRPAIATLMPKTDGRNCLVLDVGANVDCKAEHLFQFALMGEVYANNVLKIANPKIGLLSNGEEDSKGNDITKEAFKLLMQLPNFKGNVEGNDIFNGDVDVVVCDGFVGNIVLKTSEGVAESIRGFLKKHTKDSVIALTGAVLMKKVFALLKKRVDYAEYGGAPLLGVNGGVIISHGKSNPKAIKNAIFQALRYAEKNVSKDIENKIAQFPIKAPNKE
ncbi:MAG: phosphate acyltransferase PlsX [Campylobacterales bacterium]|nr:phosphate acyltransferase PlsX [Campylobacterales bacterium]